MAKKVLHFALYDLALNNKINYAVANTTRIVFVLFCTLKTTVDVLIEMMEPGIFSKKLQHLGDRRISNNYTLLV